MLLVGERRANRGRRAVANAGATRTAERLLVFVATPEARRPVAHDAALGNQGPVFLLDLTPQFHRQPRRADWTRVPRVRRLSARAIERGRVSLGQPLAALLKHRAFVGGNQPLARLRPRGARGPAIGR